MKIRYGGNLTEMKMNLTDITNVIIRIKNIVLKSQKSPTKFSSITYHLNADYRDKYLISEIKKTLFLMKKFKILKYIPEEQGYTFINLNNFGKLLSSTIEEKSVKAKELFIDKNDLIGCERVGEWNLRLNICPKKREDFGKYMDDYFVISFEDQETCDYFIEKIKYSFDKLRLPLKKKAEGIRFKLLQIDKQVDVIREKQRY